MTLVDQGKLCFIFLLSSLFILSAFSTVVTEATTEWDQVTYSDFYPGSFNNITLTKKGMGAELRLNDAPPIWTKINTAAVPSGWIWYSSIASFWGIDEVLYYGNDAQTWTYNLTSGKWIHKSPAVEPEAMYGYCAAAIHGTDKVLVFGGLYTYDSSIRDETWIYDHSEDNWTKLSTNNTPPARYISCGDIFDTEFLTNT